MRCIRSSAAVAGAAWCSKKIPEWGLGSGSQAPEHGLERLLWREKRAQGPRFSPEGPKWMVRVLSSEVGC